MGKRLTILSIKVAASADGFELDKARGAADIFFVVLYCVKAKVRVERSVDLIGRKDVEDAI